MTSIKRRLYSIVAVLFSVGCSPTIANKNSETAARGDETGGDARSAPIIIAHRGASGELPEHTLAAFERAIEQGADFIEPDLVMTRDGRLIVRHDRYLETTTDVADRPEFADRKRLGEADAYGRMRESWWAEDFTLAEIQTLRARQPFAGRDTGFDGRYPIATFEEVLALAARHGVGVYPEVKSPSLHAAAGLDMARPLLDALEGFAGPVYIQSFEQEILHRLNEQSDWPLVMLSSGEPAQASSGHIPPVDVIASFADGIGPNKALIEPDMADGRSSFVERAHERGLVVHVWTIRDDDVAAPFASSADELAHLFALGVDGAFADFPATAVKTRDAFIQEQ